MNCRQVRESFKDYLEEKLGPGQVAALNQHLQQCPDCQQELAFLKLYQSQLQTMDHPQPPADLLARVQRGIIAAEAKQSGRHFRPALLLAPGMAAVVLLLVIILVPWQFGGIPQQALILPEEDLAEEKGQPLPSPAPVASKSAAPPKPELSGLTRTTKPAVQLPLELALNLVVAPAAETLKTAADTTASPDKEKRTNQTGTAVTSSQPELGKGTTPPATAPTELVQRLRELVKSLEGIISEEKYDPQHQQLQQLTLKIPAANYQKLLTGLAGLGQLQPTAPAPLLQEGQTICLSLHYQP